MGVKDNADAGNLDSRRRKTLQALFCGNTDLDVT